jgi:hypothetical protein
MAVDERLLQVVCRQPYPLLFATISSVSGDSLRGGV